MKRLLSFLRRWLVPAILVLVAAMLTIPWTFGVVLAAYERNINRDALNLANRVQIQLTAASSSWWFTNPQQILEPIKTQQMLEPLKTELLGDKTVQAVCVLDLARGTGGFVRINEEIPIPRSPQEVDQMIGAEPTAYRKRFDWKVNDQLRGIIYVDLSRQRLWERFWQDEGPFLWRVGYLTAVAITIVSVAGIAAYRFWGTAHHQRIRSELKQAGLLAERGLTAAVLAHEIRNPLAALRFQLHSLRRNSADPDRVTRTADTIDNELSRIQQLVQDYLAHEKARVMRVAPVDLADAVRALQTLMGELLRDTGTRMIVPEPASRVVVSCDPHALRQVLMNLVLNAQQAMGQGGLITIRIGRREQFGTIAVSDTGPGIPPEMRERLFKPFATSKKEGSGIGLALVKRFVDNFGGSVSVESELGAGTTFHLRLPLADSSPPSGNVIETATPSNDEAAARVG